jgi:hypothetical protein
VRQCTHLIARCTVEVTGWTSRPNIGQVAPRAYCSRTYQIRQRAASGQTTPRRRRACAVL